MGLPLSYRVWSGLTRRGHCKRCGRAILWVMTDQGKRLPFEATVAKLRTERDELLGTKHDVYPPNALHFLTCGRSSRASRAESAGS